MGGRHSKQGKPQDQNYSVAAALARDEDPVAQAFVQRRTSLTQEQWDKFLSRDAGASSHSLSALGAYPVHSQKGSFSTKSMSSGITFNSKKMRDLEADRDGLPRNPRLARSIFGLPLGSPLTTLYKTWSTIILMLDLVYTAFLVPMLVGFELSDVDFGWGCLVNLIAGAFYFVELWLGFHIGFVGRLNTRKKLVMDGKAVAWYYLTRGQFIVDTLTAIAWIAQICLIIITQSGVNLTGSSVTTIYQIIRILRMIRFVSLMNRLYAAAIAAGGAVLPALNLSPSYAYFFNLIYGGLVILSFLSCLMNFVARKEGFTNTWLNYFPVYVRDYGSKDSQTNNELSSDETGAIPDTVKWLGGAYWMLITMLSVGYGDISPKTNTEIIITMFATITGIVFFGILLGSIAEALTDLNKESKRIARYRARMDAVDKWMGKHHLPKSLRTRIGHHYQEEWLTEAEAVEEVQIMEELPHSLRREIAFNINKKIFRQLSIFTDFPVSQQAAICGMMTPLQLPAGQDLCEADDVADCIWILHEGLVAEVDANGVESSDKMAPAVLGETALLRELDTQYHFRPCALRTRQMCLMWVIPMRDLLPLLKRNPQLYHKACSQVVPKVLMDYLTISPLESDLSGGVAPSAQNGQARPGSAQDGRQGNAPPTPRADYAVPANPYRDVTLMVKASSAMRSQGSSNQSEASSNNLQSARSMGNLAPLGSKPSWTKLQQDNLKAKRARTQHQSQGFNGLVKGTDR